MQTWQQTESHIIHCETRRGLMDSKLRRLRACVFCVCANLRSVLLSFVSRQDGMSMSEEPCRLRY
jgi:hypothetical protein